MVRNISFKNTFTCALAVCMCIAVISCGTTAKKSGNGVAVFVIGDVQLRTADGKLSKLNVSDRIGDGDSVITAKDATATIQISDSGIIRVQPESTVVMRQLLNGNNTELYLEKGELLSKVTRLKKDEKFSVKTPTSVAGVRGTEFSVRVGGGQKDVVAVRDGKVAVAAKQAESEAAVSAKEVIVEAGKAVDIPVAAADVPAAPEIVVRDITPVETLTIEKVAVVLIVPEVEKKTAVEITQAQAPVVQQETKINVQLKVEVRKEKIDQMIKKTPKSLEEIKEVFERIDEITLYSGQVIQGAIIGRGKNYQVLTTSGQVTIPENKVRKVTVLK